MYFNRDSGRGRTDSGGDLARELASKALDKTIFFLSFNKCSLYNGGPIFLKCFSLCIDRVQHNAFYINIIIHE
jgi:hypothetical protein